MKRIKKTIYLETITLVIVGLMIFSTASAITQEPQINENKVITQTIKTNNCGNFLTAKHAKYTNKNGFEFVCSVSHSINAINAKFFIFNLHSISQAGRRRFDPGLPLQLFDTIPTIYSELSI